MQSIPSLLNTSAFDGVTTCCTWFHGESESINPTGFSCETRLSILKVISVDDQTDYKNLKEDETEIRKSFNVGGQSSRNKVLDLIENLIEIKFWV